MKIILILSVLFCSQLLGVEYGEDLLSELEKYDINNADPNQTIKIVEKKEYVILFNPTVFSYEMMSIQASKLCNDINSEENIVVDFSQPLGAYTSFFSCGMIDYTNLNSSNNLKENEIRNNDFIFEIKKNNYDKISKLEQEAENIRTKKDLISNDLVTIQEDVVKMNINICKKYGFKEETETFNSCLIELLDAHKAIIDFYYKPSVIYGPVKK